MWFFSSTSESFSATAVRISLLVIPRSLAIAWTLTGRVGSGSGSLVGVASDVSDVPLSGVSASLRGPRPRRRRRRRRRLPPPSPSSSRPGSPESEDEVDLSSFEDASSSSSSSSSSMSKPPAIAMDTTSAGTGFRRLRRLRRPSPSSLEPESVGSSKSGSCSVRSSSFGVLSTGSRERSISALRSS